MIEVEHQDIQYQIDQLQADDIKRHYEIAANEESETSMVTGNHWNYCRQGESFFAR
jgi:hypothetical protein